MRRVFVVGAANPNGGTFMAYQLGLILQSEFGFQAIAVRIGSENWDHTKHDYAAFPMVSIAEMEAQIRPDDILIANPSFSKHMFGVRLPGIKLCYVQGFQTFSVLDARFDHYVAVSGFVQKFLLNVYDISTPVIAPYIEQLAQIEPPPWLERPAGTAFVYLKGPDKVAQLFLDRLRQLVGDRVDFVDVVPTMSLPRPELLRRMAACRYFLSLSPAEGFGLVPLEAMSVGAAVVGFDGFGGRQYMRSMWNCAVAPWADIELVASHLTTLVDKPDLASVLAARGRETAKDYTYERFRNAWMRFFRDGMGLREPN